MFKNPAQVATQLNKLAPNIGLGYSDCKNMIDTRLFLLGMFVIDISSLGEWVDRTYPEYKDKSLEQFLSDKDPEHLNEWKELLGVD